MNDSKDPFAVINRWWDGDIDSYQKPVTAKKASNTNKHKRTTQPTTNSSSSNGCIINNENPLALKTIITLNPVNTSNLSEDITTALPFEVRIS